MLKHEKAVEAARQAMLRERAYIAQVQMGEEPEKARAWVNEMHIFKPLRSETAEMRAAIAAFLAAVELSEGMVDSGEDVLRVLTGKWLGDAGNAMWRAMAQKLAEEIAGGGG